jgi:hypothetical protein
MDVMNASNRIRTLAWSLSWIVAVVLLTTARAQAQAPQPEALPGLRPHAAEICERLVDALVEVESAGQPRRVGRQGERGLMQVKASTWAEVTAQLFGRRVSFRAGLRAGPEPARRAGVPAPAAHLSGRAPRSVAGR